MQLKQKEYGGTDAQDAGVRRSDSHHEAGRAAYQGENCEQENDCGIGISKRLAAAGLQSDDGTGNGFATASDVEPELASDYRSGCCIVAEGHPVAKEAIDRGKSEFDGR